MLPTKFLSTNATSQLLREIQKRSLPSRIISKGHFPLGEISMRDPGRWKTTEDFKVATITSFLRHHPDRAYILIGDNGERDVAAYQRVRQDEEVGRLVKEIYIHKLYSGSGSMDPAANQHAFLTAAELATMLGGLELLNADELTRVLQVVDEGLTSARKQDRNLALPYAAELQEAQVEDIYRSLVPVQNAAAKRLLDDIHRRIRQRLGSQP